MIDREFLLAKRAEIVAQRDNAFAINQQAIGALMLIDHLLAKAEECKDSLTLDEFAKSMGADSAEILPVEGTQS